MAKGALPFNGQRGIVPLLGPAGQLLKLQAVGGKLELEWATLERQVHDLELRARIEGGNCAIGTSPVVRLALELGHGDVAYKDPPEEMAIVAGSPIMDYSIPARGLVLRFSARNVKATFTLAGMLSGAPPANFAIAVNTSIQPAASSHKPDSVYETQAGYVAGRNAFPQAAREWRAYDAFGAPLAAAAASFVGVGLFGLLIGPIDGATLADWRPIPHDANSYTVNNPCYVAFR